MHMNNLTTTFRHPFLAGLEEGHRQAFLQGAREQTYEPGEVIFREGDPASTLYLIESGRVALESGATACPTLIQTLGDGDVLGWSWLFPPFAWHFQARATEPTRVICCDGGHLLVQAEENPAFGYAVMRRFSQLVIQRLQATRRKLAQAQAALQPAATGDAK